MRLVAAVLVALLAASPAYGLILRGSGQSQGAITLGLTDLASNQIINRDGGATTRGLSIAGTYTGTPVGLQCQVNIVGGGTALAWVNATNYSAVGGNWSAKCPGVPQGAWYTLSVRDSVNHSFEADGSNSWGVGVVVWMIGQSNMLKLWSAGEGALQPTSGTYTKACTGSGWVGTRDGSIGTGAGYAYYANFLQTALGGTVPVGLIASAIGGTSITTWQSGQSSWTTATGQLTSCGITDLEVALWQQGETDAQANAPADPATYYFADIKNVHQQTLTLTGRSTAHLHFGVMGLGNFNSSSGTFSDLYATEIRDYDLQYGTGLNSPLAGSFYLSSAVDFIRQSSDSQHWAIGQSGAINSFWRAGRRYALSTEKALGLVATGAEGPAITGVIWSVGSPTLTITVTHSGGTGLADGVGGTAGTGLLGFSVGGTSATISSTAYSQPNQIVLTMSANRQPGDTPTLTYAANRNPFSYPGDGSDTAAGVTFDNQSATNIFYTGTAHYNDTGFPLQPTNGAIAIP